MIGDLARAVGQIWDLRFLGAVLGGVAVTVALLAALCWAVFTGIGTLLPETIFLPGFGDVSTKPGWLSWVGLAAAAMASVFLILPVAFLCVGLFLDPVVDAVEARHYPGCATKPRQSGLGALRDALVLVCLVSVINVFALAAYLLVMMTFPPLFWTISVWLWALNGWLLGREYFQLVAMRRMERGAARTLRGANWLQVWGLGILLAIPLSVPGVNLFVPVIGVAAYTHMWHRLTA